MGLREAAQADARQAVTLEQMGEWIDGNEWKKVTEAAEAPETPEDVRDIAKGALALNGYPRTNWGTETAEPVTGQGAPPAQVAAQEMEALRGSVARAEQVAARSVPRVVHGTPLRLTPEQHAALLLPISSNRVNPDGGQDHVEAWDVRRYLNRIFGFGGWDVTTLELALIAQMENNEKTWTRYTVIYRAQVRLTIKNPDGSPGAVFEDAATGDAINFPVNKLGDAHDFAVKTALSQALKRCAVNLGDQFGMSLYNKGSRDATIVRTLVGPVIEGSPTIVTDAVASDRVYREITPQVSDPGEFSGPTGLPSAADLRDEALTPGVTLARLKAIYDMVKHGGHHPELGQTVIVNETGDEESLVHLVWRRGKETKPEVQQ